WLFRALARHFPEQARLLFCAVFLYLPAVFWLSGIRGDGFLFLSLALLLFQALRILSGRRGPGAYLGAAAGLLGVLIFRPPFAFLLLPAVPAMLLAFRY